MTDQPAPPAEDPAGAPPSSWKRRSCLLDLLVLAAAVLLVPFQGIVWDGGFTRAEFRLTFLDAHGRPVPGVTLRVLTRAGGPSYLYPVAEFLPDSAPTSGADGRMVFHHVGGGVEFGGREHYNLVGMRFGETGAPRYVCVFVREGREVHRLRYGDLDPWRDWDRLPTVTRAWVHPDWPAREFAAHPDEGLEAMRLRLFDGNGDGQLDREERVAAGHFQRVAIDSVELDRKKQEVEFYVVERTITVPAP